MAARAVHDVIEQLQQVPTRIRNGRRVLLQSLKRVAVADVQLGFQNGVDPNGNSWKPLSWPRLRGSMAQAKPLLNTGLLRASIAGGADHVERQEGEGTIVIGTRRIGAKLLQEGGTVVPTGGRKFLAIPLTIEAARAVSPLRFPRPLRPVFGKGNSGVLVEDKKRGGPKAQYALKRSVTVPARPFLGIGDRLREKLVNVTALYVADKSRATLDNGRQP